MTKGDRTKGKGKDMYHLRFSSYSATHTAPTPGQVAALSTGESKIVEKVEKDRKEKMYFLVKVLWDRVFRRFKKQ